MRWRPDSEIEALLVERDERIRRLEEAVGTMAWWLVQAQTGFGEQDARGIERILGRPVSPEAAE